MSDQDCPTCRAATGTTRYCAPSRCYCGHEDCPAFASWVDPFALPQPTDTPAPAPATASSWDTREESTWIDKL